MPVVVRIIMASECLLIWINSRVISISVCLLDLAACVGDNTPKVHLFFGIGTCVEFGPT